MYIAVTYEKKEKQVVCNLFVNPRSVISLHNKFVCRRRPGWQMTVLSSCRVWRVVTHCHWDYLSYWWNLFSHPVSCYTIFFNFIVCDVLMFCWGSKEQKYLVLFSDIIIEHVQDILNLHDFSWLTCSVPKLFFLRTCRVIVDDKMNSLLRPIVDFEIYVFVSIRATCVQVINRSLIVCHTGVCS